MLALIIRLFLILCLATSAHFLVGCGTTAEYRRCVVGAVCKNCLPQCALCIKKSLENCRELAGENVSQLAESGCPIGVQR